MKEYLAYFASKNYEFRVPELVSIAKCLGLAFDADEPLVDNEFVSPFVKIRMENDEAVRRLCERAVSLYAIFEVWAEGKTQEAVQETVKTYVETHPEAREIVDKRSFKFRVEGFNRHYSYSEQMALIMSFTWLKWGGNVDLQNPDERFWVLELYQTSERGDPPLYCYLVRQISTAARALVDQYTLKRRSYLGTTSMESEISFFTANQALAKPGMLIFDPFVGTGSLLVTCAALGAHVIGADIDMDVLLGKVPGKNVRSNFKQYGIEDKLIDLIRFDNSKHSVWRSQRPFLDAIVCDPPYGIRAGAKKVGVRAYTLAKHERLGTSYAPRLANPNDPGWLNHASQCIPYSVGDVMMDLLDFSARSLIMGGRLVFWLPTTSDYVDEDLPIHPCFKVVANSEQKLTMYFSRRLITMEKHKDFVPGVDVGFVPELRFASEPAHANVAAKVTKQAERFDGRNETDQVPEAVITAMKRISGHDLRRMQKRERRAARKAAAAASAESSGAAPSEAEPTPSSSTSGAS